MRQFRNYFLAFIVCAVTFYIYQSALSVVGFLSVSAAPTLEVSASTKNILDSYSFRFDDLEWVGAEAYVFQDNEDTSVKMSKTDYSHEIARYFREKETLTLSESASNYVPEFELESEAEDSFLAELRDEINQHDMTTYKANQY